MGSGNSKVVIRRASPAVEIVQVHNAVNGDVNLTTTDPKQRQNTDINTTIIKKAKQPTKTPNGQNEVQSPPVDEVGENIVSETLKETEESLKSRGFTDPVLLSYCDETPALLDVFIKLYEHVQVIKANIGEDDIVSAVGKSLRSVSTFYSDPKKSFRIKKGNFLADIGFAEVFKQLFDKLLSKYPNILSCVKLETTESMDKTTANTVSKNTQIV